MSLRCFAAIVLCLSCELTAHCELSLQAEIQSLIETVTTQYGIAVGVVSADQDFGVGTGPRTSPGLAKKAAPGNLTANDTYNLGSGTKPFTATCVLRLVDQGKVSLDDKASKHIDAPMQRMFNTTIGQLFGPMAANVTVGMLVRMQSGLGDFDVNTYDDSMLKTVGVHSPLLDLQYLAKLKGPMGCQGQHCTWVCAPGTCTSYSSANFLLAGLVVLAHSGSNQTTWQTYDQLSALGPDFKPEVYRHTSFPPVGPMSSKGLTTAGNCKRDYGTVEVFSQDASIMGWSYGYTLSSPRDMAMFLFELLGPDHKFISDAQLKEMMKFTALSTGWAAGQLLYGAGLEVRNVAKTHETPPKLDDLATFVGHDGETFGFWSNQGFFPALNTSIVVMTNQDVDTTVNYAITCRIAKMVATRKGLKADSFTCVDITAGNSQSVEQMLV